MGDGYSGLKSCRHGNEGLRVTTKHVPIDHKESFRLNQLSCPVSEGKVKGKKFPLIFRLSLLHR